MTIRHIDRPHKEARDADAETRRAGRRGRANASRARRHSTYRAINLSAILTVVATQRRMPADANLKVGLLARHLAVARRHASSAMAVYGHESRATMHPLRWLL